MTVPSRREVRKWLSDLAAGEVTREEAADVARPWIGDREREVSDPTLWTPLARLASADLEDAQSHYLYDVWDFTEWLADFEMKSEFDAPPT